MLESKATLALAEEHALEANLEEATLVNSIASLDKKSSRMLRREIQALSVMESLNSEREVALAE
jgi:hypothetical protein